MPRCRGSPRDVCGASGSRAGLRMAVHGRYLVLFRDLPDKNVVRVERVLHGARNLPRLF